MENGGKEGGYGVSAVAASLTGLGGANDELRECSRAEERQICRRRTSKSITPWRLYFTWPTELVTTDEIRVGTRRERERDWGPGPD